MADAKGVLNKAGGMVEEVVSDALPPLDRSQSGLDSQTQSALQTPVDTEIEGTTQLAEPGVFDDHWLSTLDISAAIDLVEKGGPIVVVLLGLSLIATTVVLSKTYQFLRCRVGSVSRSNSAIALWIDGHGSDARNMVEGYRNPTAVVLAHGFRGLSNGVTESVIREDAERVALDQLSNLRSHLRVLESTVQIAPLLGLFGTVLGMISAFQALQSAESAVDPAILAGGIWIALMTTAVGLAVAIPIAFANAWFEGQVEQERNNIEASLTSLFTLRATAEQPGNKTRTTRLSVLNAAE
ncbi:MAG: MotA/TolQ/ExbB proton channel family protein [Pseudomonadota bacterium]